MTLPANDAADLEGTPPPAIEPEANEPTEHVVVEKPKGRVFQSVVPEIDANEKAPATPATINEKPEPAPATAAVAVAQEAGPLAIADQDWPHDFMDFEGDRLEIRLPDERALTGFALSVGKFIPADVQNDMVSLFMNRHMSPDSYGQVMARMMDPDDATYTTKTVGQLFNSIVRAASEVRAEEDKAARELEAAKKQGK